MGSGKGPASYDGGPVALWTWELIPRQLLEHESRAEEQVPLLLQMKEDKVALAKAVDSGDTDLGTSRRPALLIGLVYQVLLNLRASLSPGDFFHLLDDSITPNLKPAVKLLQGYAREGDRQLLRDFYYQDDRRTESACLEVEEAGTSSVGRMWRQTNEIGPQSTC